MRERLASRLLSFLKSLATSNLIDFTCGDALIDVMEAGEAAMGVKGRSEGVLCFSMFVVNAMSLLLSANAISATSALKLQVSSNLIFLANGFSTDIL